MNGNEPPKENFAPIGDVSSTRPPKKEKSRKKFLLMILILVLLGGIGATVYLVQQQQDLRKQAHSTGWRILERRADGNITWQYNCRNCDEGGFVEQIDPRNIRPNEHDCGKAGAQGCGGYSSGAGATRYKCAVDPNNPFGSPPQSTRDQWFRRGCQTGVPGVTSVERNVGAVDYNFCGLQQIDKNGTFYSYWDVRDATCRPACPIPTCPSSVTPSGEVNPGDQDIVWSAVPGSNSYALRVEDNETAGSHADVCGKPAGSDHVGDECLSGDVTRWTYRFERGHTYLIWVHGGNNCGSSPCVGQTTVSVPQPAPPPPPPPACPIPGSVSNLEITCPVCQ